MRVCQRYSLGLNWGLYEADIRTIISIVVHTQNLTQAERHYKILGEKIRLFKPLTRAG
jgi:hypothetical protein